jgi:hypothetical protein
VEVGGMIARLGYFEGLTEEQKIAQEDNGRRRLKPFMITQPGFVAVFYLEQPNGDRVSLSVWESQQLMEEAGARMNATRLLPGQRGEDIPSPERVAIWQVRDHYLASPMDAARSSSSSS